MKIKALFAKVKKVQPNLKPISNTHWFQHIDYIFIFLICLLAAIGSLAMGIALTLTLGLAGPMLLTMAPFGAFFFASVMGAFYALGKFETPRIGLHYVMSGLNSALNAAYITNSILKVTLAVGIILAGGPPGWLIGGAVLASSTVGFVLGILERKQKYDENKKLKEIFSSKQAQKSDIERENAKQISALDKTLAEATTDPKTAAAKKQYIDKLLQQWEDNYQVILKQEIKAPAPTANEKKSLGVKLASKIVKAGKAIHFDGIVERLNDIKNYSRNIKLMLSLMLGILTIAIGITTLNPLLIVGGAALGITFASLNYFRDKWEDKVFQENGKYTKAISCIDLEVALQQEKLQLLEQLRNISENPSEQSDAQSCLSKDSNSRQLAEKFPNPLANMPNYSAAGMLVRSTFTSVETAAFAGLALAAAVIGLKLAPVTGGASAVLGIAVAAFFGIMAVGNVVRRGYKEIKQVHKRNDAEQEYQYLQAELAKRSSIQPVVEKDTIVIHNYRSDLGGSNYMAYKASSGVKKVEKSYNTISEILHYGQPLLIGAGIGIVTFNPVFLGIGLLVGGSLAILNYISERARIKRDIALDNLKLTNEAMKTEVKRLDMAAKRQEIVKQVQADLLAKPNSDEVVAAHQPTEAPNVARRTLGFVEVADNRFSFLQNMGRGGSVKEISCEAQVSVQASAGPVDYMLPIAAVA